MSEVLAPLLPALDDEALCHMKRLQREMGAIQDLSVLRATLVRVAPELESVAAGALATFRSELAQRQAAAVAAFLQRADDLLRF